MTIRGLSKSFAGQPLYTNFNLDLPRPRDTEIMSHAEFIRVKAHKVQRTSAPKDLMLEGE